MSTPTDERERITTRISSQVAVKLQEAAELTGATLNQFMVQAALEKAQRIIDRENLIMFSAEDAAMFINMLENPRPPNEALMQAFERHKQKEKNGLLWNRADSNT